jgi:hypothetical protein
MQDYGESLRRALKSRDTTRFSRFLWEWGLRLASPRFLDMANMPAGDLRSVMDQLAMEDARMVLSTYSGSSQS